MQNVILVFALVIPCMNGTSIQTHAADATVRKIYANVTGEDFDNIELVTGSGSIAGKELIGKFITDGCYTLTEEDSDKLIIADNAEITAGDITISEFKLSGNSSLIYPDYTLSSTAEMFPAYPDGEVTVAGLENHYTVEGTPYYSDPERDIWSQCYNLTVNGNMPIDGWLAYYDMTVTSTGNITVNGGSHLQVINSLTVESGGKVTGSGYVAAYLNVYKDATVSGLTLYSDNSNTLDLSSPATEDYEFRFDNTASKWIQKLELPVFQFNIGGFDPDHENITVQYKYSNDENYTDVAANDLVTTWGEGDSFSYEFPLKNFDPETNTSVYLKLNFIPATGSNKIMACWSTMEDEFNFRNEGISDDMLTLEHGFDIYDFVNVSLNYPNSGNCEIIDTANDYLYAYAGEDEETIKTYLATELYNRFISVPMYEDFGLYKLEAIEDRINELVNRITVTGSSNSISATAKDGSIVTIPINNYKVSWGNNIDNGKPVESNIPVYTLPDKNNFLICMDFDKNTGTGNTFYIRKAQEDAVSFDIEGQYGDYAIPVIVTSIDPERIVVGGMGADITVQNSDNVYAFSLMSRWLNANARSGPGQESDSDPTDYFEKVRIMIASETYTMLKGEGETKSYGNIGNNGSETDTIWNTRSNGDAEALVYIGLSTLHLRPLTKETGIAVREITAVELADDSLSAGVHIDASDISDIKITFDSNFYATIPLNITYSDGKTRKLTINRIGLVIQYTYLGGEPNEDSNEPDQTDLIFDSRGETINVKYDYFAGEQIIVFGVYYTPTNDPTGNSSDLSLYLTFNDGTHRVITSENNDTLTMSDGSTVSRGFNGKLAATDDSVATTVFLIGFAESKNFDGYLWIDNITDTYYSYEGNKGFYANVLNAGWDDDDSFGGTQVGSGKGIYWDGHITWY